MKEKILKEVLKYIIGMLGASILVYNIGWEALVGILLLMWANNFDYKQE